MVCDLCPALRDRRAIKFPNRFRLGPEHGAADLIFGDGTHACLGNHLAMAQITETFMILLSQANLRRPKWSLPRVARHPLGRTVPALVRHGVRSGDLA